jgi:hypothetical protein
MKAWTRARTLAAGATLIVLTNAAALAGAFLNRNAEAESRTTLSERELALPYGGYRQAENSGLALQLNWRVLDENPDHWDHGYARHGGQPAWLDAALLTSLGFDTTAGAATSEARQRFTRQLPRQVLLVLELEGPTWQQAVIRARENAARQTAAAAANPGSEQFAKQAEAGRARVALEETHASRLFAIDAGLDADALRRRYPDRSRHLIVRGTVRPAERGPDGDHRLAGHVSQIAIAQVNVPFALRPVLEPLRNAPSPAPDQQAPRYEVQLAIGQRLEPWIERVTTLPER